MKTLSFPSPSVVEGVHLLTHFPNSTESRSHMGSWHGLGQWMKPTVTTSSISGRLNVCDVALSLTGPRVRLCEPSACGSFCGVLGFSSVGQQEPTATLPVGFHVCLPKSIRSLCARSLSLSSAYWGLLQFLCLIISMTFPSISRVVR